MELYNGRPEDTSGRKEKEIKDGEVMYSPKQLTLGSGERAGNGDL